MPRLGLTTKRPLGSEAQVRTDSAVVPALVETERVEVARFFTFTATLNERPAPTRFGVLTQTLRSGFPVGVGGAIESVGAESDDPGPRSLVAVTSTRILEPWSAAVRV